MLNGFEIKEFDFEGITARIVFPKSESDDIDHPKRVVLLYIYNKELRVIVDFC